MKVQKCGQKNFYNSFVILIFNITDFKRFQFFTNGTCGEEGRVGLGGGRGMHYQSDRLQRVSMTQGKKHEYGFSDLILDVFSYTKTSKDGYVRIFFKTISASCS